MANRQLAEGSIVVVCIFAIGFLVGSWAEPKLCPVIEGHTPITTTSDRFGEYCTYVKTTGLATRRVRL